MAEELKDITANEDSNLTGTATDNTQVESVEGEEQNKNQDSRLFDKGYAQGVKKGAEKLLEKFGVKTEEELAQKLNDKENKEQSETDRISTLEKSLNELKEELDKERKEKQELVKQTSKNEVLSKLKEEFGYDLLPSLANLVDGETKEDIEAKARAFYEELGDYKPAKKQPKAMGAPTNPAQTSQITKEQFRKMDYNEREALYESNPELYKQLRGY